MVIWATAVWVICSRFLSSPLAAPSWLSGKPLLLKKVLRTTGDFLWWLAESQCPLQSPSGHLFLRRGIFWILESSTCPASAMGDARVSPSHPLQCEGPREWTHAVLGKLLCGAFVARVLATFLPQPLSLYFQVCYWLLFEAGNNFKSPLFLDQIQGGADWTWGYSHRPQCQRSEILLHEIDLH